MKKILLILVVLLATGALLWQREIVHLYQVSTLFSESKIVHNFSHMDTIFDTVPVANNATEHFVFDINNQGLPTSFEFEGNTYAMSDYLKQSHTTALVVVNGPFITFERYFLGTHEQDKRISWSVSKGYIGALAGIALNEFKQYSINTKVVELVPELKDSGYEHTTIKHLLQMSSGIAFNEDYADSDSDVNRLKKILALGGSFDEFASTLSSQREPGTFLKYVSMDTHVLGMVIRRMTNMPINLYLQEKLWKPLGSEYDAYFIVDSEGQPMVLGGLNATTRDYAKLGMLYRDNGIFADQQILPSSWVEKSTSPDAPYLIPGKRDNAATLFGYGFQWWLPVNAQQEFFALGVYGQFIYVNKKHNTVIVKNSANTAFAQNDFKSIHQAIAACRAIAMHADIDALSLSAMH